MMVLLSTQNPFEGSIVMFLVSIVVTPIGACSQILVYGFVTTRRSFTLLDGVFSGLAAATIIFIIMVASGEPFLTFVSGYVFASGIVLGGICTYTAYPEVRPPALKWLRRYVGAKNSSASESVAADDK